jgi:imidazolonepropionase-like amidohydrolase
MSARVKDAIKHELDAAVAILTKAYEQGATLIAGSESGFAMTPYGHWHTRELELFVSHLGMSDMRAILCMTRDAAVAAPRDSATIGTIAPGKHADLLVVDGEPDHDVRLLADRSRLRVVKGGDEVGPWRPPDLPTARMPFESARPYASERYERPR